MEVMNVNGIRLNFPNDVAGSIVNNLFVSVAKKNLPIVTDGIDVQLPATYKSLQIAKISREGACEHMNNVPTSEPFACEIERILVPATWERRIKYCRYQDSRFNDQSPPHLDTVL